MGEAERRHVFVCDAEGKEFGGDWGEGRILGMNRGWLVLEVKKLFILRKAD